MFDEFKKWWNEDSDAAPKKKKAVKKPAKTLTAFEKALNEYKTKHDAYNNFEKTERMHPPALTKTKTAKRKAFEAKATKMDKMWRTEMPELRRSLVNYMMHHSNLSREQADRTLAGYVMTSKVNHNANWDKWYVDSHNKMKAIIANSKRENTIKEKKASASPTKKTSNDQLKYCPFCSHKLPTQSMISSGKCRG